MEAELNALLRGLPNVLAYFASGLVFTALYFVVYTFVTPHDEMKLIRAGNPAAAVSLGGAMIGFLLPLASIIAHSASLADKAIWSVIALIVQIVGFFIARALIPGLPQAITEGKMSCAAFAATISLCIGILNAACMSY